MRTCQPRRRFRPVIETLEDRLALAGAPLTEPPVIRSANGVLTATLTMAVGPTTIGDTPVADAWMYNGSYVGPTLVARPGDRLDLTIANYVPQTTNLHTHGLHVSPIGNSDNVLLELEPGQSNRYQIQIPTDHPEGLYWYHPHRHGTVNNQIIRGLSGFLVIGRPDGGPTQLNGLTQHILGIKNAQVQNGQVVNNPENPNPLQQTYTVNGQAQPTLTIRPGEWQVFNVGNIGNNSFYDLVVVDHLGHEVPLYAVAADGNPFTAVQQYASLEAPPGRRWSFTFQPPATVPLGQTVQWTIRSRGYLDGFLFWPPQTLVTLNYTGTPVAMAAPVTAGMALTSPNQNFRDLSQLPATAIAQHRTVLFEQGFNSEGTFVTLVNGGQFPNNPVFNPRLNTVEEWTILNPTTDDHPFHLHTNPFQVIQVTYPPGVPNPYPNGFPYYLDVVNVPRGGSVTIRVEFLDYIGTAVYHCHRVDHEDEGMMALVNILPQQSIRVTGAGPGGSPQVNVYDGSTDTLLRSFFAFDPSFTGGVTVATGDVTGDGVTDIICGAGPGGGPQVTVFDGVTYQPILNFFAWPLGSFTGGVFVAAGDIDNDGRDDIIVGAGPGAGPEVKVFRSYDGQLLRDFYAFDAAFTGGVTVAAADIDGNGRIEIIVGAGPGGGPQVNVYDNHPHLLVSFYAFDASFRGGVFVSTGWVRGTGFESILCGAGAGGGPQVTVFNTVSNEEHTGQGHGGQSQETTTATTASATGHRQLEMEEIDSFYAFAPTFTSGVRVGAVYKAQGANFFLGAGGGSPLAETLDGITHALLSSILAYPANFQGGVSVAAN